jgi:hypothetical protein
MRTAGTMIRSAILAAVIPVFLLLILVALSEWTWRDSPDGDTYDYAAMAVSAVMGFGFLGREWKWWSLLIAVAYFPLMWAALIGVAVGAQCGFHGRCL